MKLGAVEKAREALYPCGAGYSGPRGDRGTISNSARFDLIVHCAAQPSHDKAKDIPLLDFEVNALGTINLLEATRQHSPEAVFEFLSTKKVYGDAPNEIPLKELEKRYDYARPEDYDGIDETCRVDRTLHSLFGQRRRIW